jgi:hypothetical protein
MRPGSAKENHSDSGPLGATLRLEMGILGKKPQDLEDADMPIDAEHCGEWKI